MVTRGLISEFLIVVISVIAGLGVYASSTVSPYLPACIVLLVVGGILANEVIHDLTLKTKRGVYAEEKNSGLEILRRMRFNCKNSVSTLDLQMIRSDLLNISDDISCSNSCEIGESKMADGNRPMIPLNTDKISTLARFREAQSPTSINTKLNSRRTFDLYSQTAPAPYTAGDLQDNDVSPFYPDEIEAVLSDSAVGSTFKRAQVNDVPVEPIKHAFLAKKILAGSSDDSEQNSEAISVGSSLDSNELDRRVREKRVLLPPLLSGHSPLLDCQNVKKRVNICPEVEANSFVSTFSYDSMANGSPRLSHTCGVSQFPSNGDSRLPSAKKRVNISPHIEVNTFQSQFSRSYSPRSYRNEEEDANSITPSQDDDSESLSQSTCHEEENREEVMVSSHPVLEAPPHSSPSDPPEELPPEAVEHPNVVQVFSNDGSVTSATQGKVHIRRKDYLQMVNVVIDYMRRTKESTQSMIAEYILQELGLSVYGGESDPKQVSSQRRIIAKMIQRMIDVDKLLVVKLPSPFTTTRQSQESAPVLILNNDVVAGNSMKH